MPVTERGKWATSLLDERGNKVFGSLTDRGKMVIGNNPAVLVTVTLTDSFIATDTITFSKGKYLNLNDTFALSESLSSQNHVNRSALFSDGLTITDLFWKQFTTSRQETLNSTDGTLRRTFGFVKQDTVGATDTTLKKTVAKVNQELFTLLDTVRKSSSLKKVDVLVTADSLKIHIPGADLIGTITLQGDQELYVYLLGEQISFVTLKGELPYAEPDSVLEGSYIMTATNQNFTMYSGNSKNIVANLTGDSLNMSGASFTWVAKENDVSDVTLLTKTNTNGGITLPGGNQIKIALTPSDTQTLEGSYYHECNMVDVNGNPSTLFVGTMTIKKSHI